MKQLTEKYTAEDMAYAEIIGAAKKRGAVDFIQEKKIKENPYTVPGDLRWAWTDGYGRSALAAYC